MQERSDATPISTGGMLKITTDAAEMLAMKRIQARVLSMCTVKPIDKAAVLQAVRETGKIVTVEEHSVSGGLGGAVAAVLDRESVHPVLQQVALPDSAGKIVGAQAYLRKKFGLTRECIQDIVVDMMVTDGR